MASGVALFVEAWSALRKRVKQIQYQAVRELSQLQELRVQIEALTVSTVSADLHAERVSQLAQQIARLEAWEEHRWRLWSGERFMHLGDTNSSYFLRRFRARRSKTKIQSLITPEGCLNTPAKITKEVHRHFSEVFSAPEPYADDSVPRDFLSVFTGRVSREQLAYLDDLPTHVEFTDELLASAKGKSPGFDGFNIDAIRAIWSFVGPTYVSAMQECWRTRNFPKGFMEGIIILIPKETGIESLAGWRPITLLSSIYKLFAKLIASRLALILPTLVPVQQQGFIVGRNVHNNVLFFTLVHELLKRERRPASFIMLDLAKAFDTLRHDFLFLALESLGFSAHFILLIRCISEGAFARVIVGNFMTPDFPILRGVRQGCPLAPLLFVLASSALLLQAEVDADLGRLTRVTVRSLRHPLPVTSAFADDTAFLLGTNPECFQNLMSLLDRFTLAVGCSVNWRKTWHLSAGKYAPPPLWMHGFPLQILHRAQGVRYLGIMVANKSSPADTWSFVTSKLIKRLAAFSHKLLKFEAKVIILRYLLQTILPYSLALIKFRLQDIHRLERIFAVFLWGTKPDGDSKTTLVAWPRVALPLELGGAGLWSMVDFQHALLGKLVLNSIDNEDSLWAKDVLEISVIMLHDSNSLDRIEELSNWGFTAASWEFNAVEWRLKAPISGSHGAFPLKVSLIHRTLSEAGVPVFISPLLSRWDLNWSVLQWAQLCKGLCGTGLHRRDLLFLWRVLARAFFTGSRAVRMRVADGLCPYCSQEVETVAHLFFLCPVKKIL
ncbi:hypothetical protein R1sor_021601 [Riccia sorocarpa]|uniref:Reverse transcriptase domain-containing protein n=1 Tax=Riccia sorocarpa TaxID=122646 RepID=A0ABD3GHH5_9MARC